MSILTDTAMQSLLSLADCSVNDTLVKVVPLLKQSFFRMINVMDPAALHSLLQNAPARSRRLTEANDQFFWKFSYYFLSTISFSTWRPLIKILSSFDNILLTFLSADGRHS